MPTSNRSAQAYDKLSRLSAQADLAAAIAFDWTKLSRVLSSLMDDLKLDSSAERTVVESIEEFRGLVAQQRNVYRDLASRKQSDAITLNEQIQNGVYQE